MIVWRLVKLEINMQQDILAELSGFESQLATCRLGIR